MRRPEVFFSLGMMQRMKWGWVWWSMCMRLLSDSRYIIDTVMNDADLPFFFWPPVPASNIPFSFVERIESRKFEISATITITWFLINVWPLQIQNVCYKWSPGNSDRIEGLYERGIGECTSFGSLSGLLLRLVVGPDVQHELIAGARLQTLYRRVVQRILVLLQEVVRIVSHLQNSFPIPSIFHYASKIMWIGWFKKKWKDDERSVDNGCKRAMKDWRFRHSGRWQSGPRPACPWAVGVSGSWDACPDVGRSTSARRSCPLPWAQCTPRPTSTRFPMAETHRRSQSLHLTVSTKKWKTDPKFYDIRMLNRVHITVYLGTAECENLQKVWMPSLGKS